MDLSYATTSVLADALKSGELSSRELLDHQLNRIERINPDLNAVVTLDPDQARERAAAADEATSRGESWGPLHGITMTVKDVFETAGMRTTAGAPELSDHIPETDAVTVARLRGAGAIVIGKTNTPLYAGDDQTFNEVFGRTNNPWDLTRTTGGSSGGSAAAVAAGLTPLELGSDIGGSIRAPSHFCGTYGLKGSWGTVPSRGHIPGQPGSLIEPDVNYCGPIARSVADLELALGVLAGPLPEDAAGWSLNLPEPTALGPIYLDGLRIAVSFDEVGFPIASEVSAVLRRYVDRLADAGGAVAPVPLPVPQRDLADAWLDLVIPQVGADLPDHAWSEFLGLSDLDPGDNAVMRAARAMAMRFRDHRAADQRRQEHRQRWATHFDQYDIVLAPVMPVVAFPHDERPVLERDVDIDGLSVPHLDIVTWCGGVGTSLLPVVALPTGQTASGLPVGIQVIGPWLQDRRVLAIATTLDEVAGGFTPPPAYPA